MDDACAAVGLKRKQSVEEYDSLISAMNTFFMFADCYRTLPFHKHFDQRLTLHGTGRHALQ